MIQFSISMEFNCQKHFYFKLFSLIKQSITNNAVYFYLTHSGPEQTWSNGNEGVLCIPQSLSITGTSPSDCLVSYLGHSLVGSYSSAEVQLVYSTALANWAIHRVKVKTVLFPAIQFSISIQFKCKKQ